VVEAGATILVAGNAIFSAPDPEAATRALRAAANGAAAAGTRA
jgi:thiamine monophosphate synthase